MQEELRRSSQPVCSSPWTRVALSHRCVFASGSPFDPVPHESGRTFRPSQCNNMFIFPGLGLGALLARAKVLSPYRVHRTPPRRL